MDRPVVAIIGGSGLGAALAQQTAGQSVVVETPYGPPSAPLVRTEFAGLTTYFLARHGTGHVYNPSIVPYRANIFALKKVGVTHILASGATGSLREQIAPKDLVIPDQVIDKTFRRAGTFFDEPGLVAHVEFAHPFCPALRHVLIEAGKAIPSTVHHRGTYVCMEGPQFSTVAESRMHQTWGGDLIGMTCMPEAKLAREAEMCYALIALPTDYDCWRPHDPTMSQHALLAEIVGNLTTATENAIQLVKAAVQYLAGNSRIPCHCHKALELAIWTDKAKIPAATREKLQPIIGKYLG